MEHYDVSLGLWSKCDDDVMGGVYDSGVWWFISSSICWLAKIHSEQKCITTLQLWTAIFFSFFTFEKLKIRGLCWNVDEKYKFSPTVH